MSLPHAKKSDFAKSVFIASMSLTIVVKWAIICGILLVMLNCSIFSIIFFSWGIAYAQGFRSAVKSFTNFIMSATTFTRDEIWWMSTFFMSCTRLPRSVINPSQSSMHSSINLMSTSTPHPSKNPFRNYSTSVLLSPSGTGDLSKMISIRSPTL